MKRRVKIPRSAGAFVIALVAAVVAMAAFALPVWASTTWNATMNGASEVPPTASLGAGTGSVVLNDTEDSALVSNNFYGLSSPVISWHVHCPGPVGVDGPIVFDPISTVPGNNLKWVISPADVGHLQAGNCYMNVHTMTNPGGEIRGQLVLGAVGGVGELVDATSLPGGGGASTSGIIMMAALTAAIGLAAAGAAGAAWRIKGRLIR